MIKRIVLFLAALFVGCQGSDERLRQWMEGEGKLRVLSTTVQIGDLVEAVGGDRVDSLVLIAGDLNPHTYELVKGDGEKLERADCIFYNGLGLEHGASLSSFLKGSGKALAVGDWIAEKQSEQILRQGEVIDPHIWMDLSLWEGAVEAIVERLSAKDPEGAEEFAMRGEQLRGEMERIDGKMRALMTRVPLEKRYLVTSHDAFHYFTRRYLAAEGERNWEERFAAPEGLAPDGQLSPVDIRKIIEFLKTHEISVLFPESNVSRDSIRKIASAGRELGLEIQICTEPLYGDSTSGLPYLESMRKNAEVISTYLH